MPTKAQILTTLNDRCVDAQGITLEFMRTEQHDTNNPNQTDQGAAVNVYRFLGLFPAGKVTARVKWVTFYVQDEGTASEDAYIQPDDLDGIFRGEVEAYMDGIAAIKDYEIEKTNIVKNTATVKAALSDGASGRQVVYKFVEKDQQGNFTSYDITSGSWQMPA